MIEIVDTKKYERITLPLKKVKKLFIKNHRGCVKAWTLSPILKIGPYPFNELIIILAVIKASSEIQKLLR